MFNSLTSLFKQLVEGSDLGKTPTASPNLAIASLLCEVAGADHAINESEQEAKLHLLQRLLNITEDESKALLAQAEPQVEQSVSLYDFTFSTARAVSTSPHRSNKGNVGSGTC